MKRQALELIRFLTQLTPTALLVSAPRRRRLWGGSFPSDYVGTNYAFFGGHNYGYGATPAGWRRSMPGLGDDNLQRVAQVLTWTGFATTGILTFGAFEVSHGYTWLKMLAASVAASEGLSYWESRQTLSKAKVIQAEAPQYDWGHLEDPDVTRALRGETRTNSGSSLACAMLAGFCLNRTGFIGWNGYWHKNWVSFYAANYVFTSFLFMFVVDAMTQTEGIVSHAYHFWGTILGYWMGSFFTKFMR